MEIKSILEEKKRLRRELTSIRNNLSEVELITKSKNIVETLISLDIYKKSDIIYSYGSFRSEVNTWQLNKTILLNGKTLALPKVLSGGYMQFYKIPDLSKLIPGYMGILEPGPDCEEMSSDDTGLILVPGLGFDRMMYRIGYGGGFYDRYLQNTSVNNISCGLAFDEQIISQVPRESTDFPLDFVLTESGILKG